MKITLVYESGEDKNSPNYTSHSKAINGDFSREELKQAVAEFTAEVEKIVNASSGSHEECPYCKSTEPCNGDNSECSMNDGVK